MNITVFTFFIAVFWCNIFIIFVLCLQKSTRFIANFSLIPLLLLFVICIFRLLGSFEYPYTRVIPSTIIFPAITSFFTVPRVSFDNIGVAINILDCCICIWAIGSLYFIIRYVLYSVRITRAIKAQKTTENMQINQVMKKIIESSGKNVKLRVVQTKVVLTPIVVGFLHPTIVLPDEAFTKEELHIILSHEWYHCLHKDARLKLIMNLICGIFWWNPFMHLLKASLNHMLEIRCDLALTSKMQETEKLKYAELLFRMFQTYCQSKKHATDYAQAYNVSALFSAKKQSKLEQRILLILSTSKNKNHRLGMFLICAAMITFFLGSTLFVVQPVYPPPVKKEAADFTFTITPKNAYLIDLEDGTYALYVKGKYQGDIEERLTTKEPFMLLPLK